MLRNNFRTSSVSHNKCIKFDTSLKKLKSKVEEKYKLIQGSFGENDQHSGRSLRIKIQTV